MSGVCIQHLSTTSAGR